MKRPLRKTARPVLDELEARVLLAGSIATGVTPGSPQEIRILQPSGVKRVNLDRHGLTVNNGVRSHVTISVSQQLSHGRDASVLAPAHPTAGDRARVVKLASDVNLPKEYPVIDRLGEFVEDSHSQHGGYFLPVQPGSVGTDNTKNFADNVYVIAHGWMPGYIWWVEKGLSSGKLPLSWQTWLGGAGVEKAFAPSTPWLYQGSKANPPHHVPFAVNETGLAEAILDVDPNATVLAYSWIDNSATPTNIDPSSPVAIPEQGYKSEGYTTMNGVRMAAAVMDALAPNYYEGLGKVHLIGHSHGSRVAAAAALTLQQAALQNPQDPQFNVVRQLTLLDSPENSKTAAQNPVSIDAANFNWFYLAQMYMPGRYALTGTVTNGQQTVTVPTLTGLSAGMGVTGPGVAAGTTIDSIVPTKNQVVLTVPVNVTSSPVGASLSLGLGFWNWSNDAIFVDSYTSYFGTDFNNFIVNDPGQGYNVNGAGQGMNNSSLYNVVDAKLDPIKLYGDHYSTISTNHQYSANWYAGSATSRNTPNQTGLLWSPLISGSSLPPASSTQEWRPIKAGQQFVLTGRQPAPDVKPGFVPVTLKQNNTEGHVFPTGQANQISAVKFDDNEGTEKAVFHGELYVSHAAEGFSFTYNFTGGSTDGSQLQILVKGDPYFEMTGSVAESSTLNNSGHQFTGTFGLGSRYAGWKDITIRLVPSEDGGDNGQGTPTTVTVNSFREFSL